MPRKPREEEAGAIHHVYARGNDKRSIYLDDRDRRAYVALLAQVVRRQAWLLLAYCLMDNHVHLLVETPEANLGEGVQRLHGDYALLFNRRHRRSGHLFQGRYGAKRVRDDAQLLTAARYIAENPVDAAMCDRPVDWPWSSVPSIVAGEARDWLAGEQLLGYLRGIVGDVPRAQLTALLSAP